MKNFIYEKNNSGYSIIGLKSNCKNLVIPEGVTRIEGRAFIEGEIESVVFPKSLIYIGECAFDSCQNLERVVFPSDSALEEIDEYAFSFCQLIEEIQIPKSVKTIRMGAFSNCFNLSKVSIYDSVKIVKAETFWGCDSLKSVTVYGTSIPSTWQDGWIEKGVKVRFESDRVSKTTATKTAVKAATTKTTVKPTAKPAPAVKTGEKTNFESGFSLKSTAKSNAKTVVKEAIKPHEKQKNISAVNEVKKVKSEPIAQLNGYKCNDLSEFELKKSLDGLYIASVLDKNIKSLVIPKEVEVIGSYDDSCIFANCTSLERVIGHDNLKAIWRFSFLNCTSLKEVKLSRNTSVYEYAFENCTSLKTAYVNESCFKYAYAGSCIKNVEFVRDRELVLSEGLFSGTPLESITLPNNIDYLSDKVFYNCKQLKKAVLNEGLSYLFKYCFYGCEKLEEIDIPKTVRSIGDGAFSHCYALKKVTMHEGSLYYISKNSFDSCINLEEISIPDCAGTIFDMAFNDCRNLKSVKLGKGLKLISSYAFLGCENLREIVIPKNVITVCNNAFDSRYIKKITIIRDRALKTGNKNDERAYQNWLTKDNRANVTIKIIYE